MLFLKTPLYQQPVNEWGGWTPLLQTYKKIKEISEMGEKFGILLKSV
jgi:hypothetical protein